MVSIRIGVLVATTAAVAAGSFPPNGPWSVVNDSAHASGAVQSRAASPGTLGRYYDVTGTLTVGAADGFCYYMRYYVSQDLLGTGVNSPRQCGPGSLPLSQTVYAGPLARGFRFGLCRATPGTAQESPTTGLGANCVAV